MALVDSNQGLEALEEFITVLLLRDDENEAMRLVELGMKAVPGNKLSDPIYLKAKALVERYEKSSYRPSAYGKAIDWLVLAKTWQGREDSPLVPPVDRIVSKQAVAVPLTDERLVVDAAAVGDAELAYIDTGAGDLVRAEVVKNLSYTSTRPGKQTLPLAVLRAINAKFTPVKVTELKAEQPVLVQTANLYRPMGTDLVAIQTKVVAADANGVRLEKQI
jgi:hypothetical protein